LISDGAAHTLLLTAVFNVKTGVFGAGIGGMKPLASAVVVVGMVGTGAAEVGRAEGKGVAVYNAE